MMDLKLGSRVLTGTNTYACTLIDTPNFITLFSTDLKHNDFPGYCIIWSCRDLKL